jgi:hypothetical protein
VEVDARPKERHIPRNLKNTHHCSKRETSENGSSEAARMNDCAITVDHSQATAAASHKGLQEEETNAKGFPSTSCTTAVREMRTIGGNR